MFEKFGRAAEEVATSLSRRQALGRLGRSALAVAGAFAGFNLYAGTGGNICSQNSPNGCANQPQGTPCVGSPGKCWSDPKQRDSAGRLICNVCRLPRDHKN